MNLAHSVCGSEIPENFETETDSTSVVTTVLPTKKRILECLREAGGDSLSLSEIAEETGLDEPRIQKILSKESAVQIEMREVFEDENEPGSYFLTEPILDRLATGEW